MATMEETEPTIEVKVATKATAEGTGKITINALTSLLNKFPTDATVTKFDVRSDSWYIEANLSK